MTAPLSDTLQFLDSVALPFAEARDRPRRVAQQRRRLVVDPRTRAAAGFSQGFPDAEQTDQEGRDELSPRTQPTGHKPPLPSTGSRQPWWHRPLPWIVEEELPPSELSRSPRAKGVCELLKDFWMQPPRSPHRAVRPRRPGTAGRAARTRLARTASKITSLSISESGTQCFQPPRSADSGRNTLTQDWSRSTLTGSDEWSGWTTLPSQDTPNYSLFSENPFEWQPTAPKSHSQDSNSEQSAVAERLAWRYSRSLGGLKDQQAQWRKQHDAFVRKRSVRLAKLDALKSSPAKLDEGLEFMVTAAGDQHCTGSSTGSSSSQNSRCSSPANHGGSGEDEAASEDSDSNHSEEAVCALPSQSLLGHRPFLNVPKDGSHDPQARRRSSRLSVVRGVIGLTAGAEPSRLKGPRASCLHPSSPGRANRLSTGAAGADAAPGPQVQPEPRVSAFDSALALARKHKLSVEEVRRRRDEFDDLNLNEEGELAVDCFKDVVRTYCGILPGEEIPARLLRREWAQIDTDNSGTVSFEEFLLWTVTTAWLPERLCSDPVERQLRKIARDYGLNINDIERIKSAFDRFDKEKTGFVEETGFKSLMLVLMNVKNPADVSEKRLERCWREADMEKKGKICFETFLYWYFYLFNY